MRVSSPRAWNLDIDRYTNPWTPRNPIYLLPRPISHFLGYRTRPEKEVGDVVVAVWALVGAFALVVVLAATFMIPEIQSHAPPIVIGSFVRMTLKPGQEENPANVYSQGAAAILEFNTIESPLAQPRNGIIGNLLAATIGVGVTKLFKMSRNFEQLRYLAGGLGCGLASAAMTLTKTIYPPAGATALLASVDPQVEQLGWYLPPLVFLSSLLTLVTSLLLNNIQRRYPTYWWTPADLGGRKKDSKDLEKTPSETTEVSLRVDSVRSEVKGSEVSMPLAIWITTDKIIVPDNFYLATEEEDILEILRDRLRQGLPSSNERS